MTVTGHERVAGLNEQAANAVIAARASLSLAADAAEEVDAVLRRSESDIDELSGEARRMSFADEPGRHLRSAQGLAEGIDHRIRLGRGKLEEVRGHLDQGALALNASRHALAELEQVHGQRGGATENLKHRLEGLGRAVTEAHQGVDEAVRRLDNAKQNLQPLIDPARYNGRGLTATAVGEVHTAVTEDVSTVRQGLAGLQTNFDATHSEASRAAQQSVDLATAARAGMNPTPPAGRRESAAPAEQDLRLRQGSAAQGPGQER